MKKSEFNAYPEQEINTAQGRISSKDSKFDQFDSGRVGFLTAFKGARWETPPQKCGRRRCRQ